MKEWHILCISNLTQNENRRDYVLIFSYHGDLAILFYNRTTFMILKNFNILHLAKVFATQPSSFLLYSD